MSMPVGVIEGFFGRPWGDKARRACAEFLRERDLSYYIYAPKADRNLRKAWREPMAVDELTNLTALAAHFHACGVRFGVGLTPYALHLDYSDESRAALRAKVRQLNGVGADILCILFDDMNGAVAHLAQLQSRIVKDISEWTQASRLIFCPTYYSDDPILARVFGPPPAGYLEDLGRALDPAVDVFWTGERVCSSGYSDRHLERIIARLGRRPFIWDNHIANDARDRCAHLYLDAFAGGWSLNTDLASGLAINPMNQPFLSRIPLAACAELTRVRSGLVTLASSICGSGFADELISALPLIQNAGLAGLDAPTRAMLIETFGQYEPHDGAAEIIGWLKGEYSFDPDCLTD
jgi:hypothetical protein